MVKASTTRFELYSGSSEIYEWCNGGFVHYFTQNGVDQF